MTIQIWIGGATEPGRWRVTADVAGVELLSEPAVERLVAGGELCVPWAVALAAADLLDDDSDREDVLRAAMPPWLGPDDVEIMLDIVQAARLPRRTPLRLRLGFEGVAGRPGFKLKAEWVAGGGRVMRVPPEVEGGRVVNRQDQTRRLSSGQFRVLEILAEQVNLGSDQSVDLEQQARLCAAAPVGDPGVVLDRALEMNRATVVERVSPRFVPSPGGYQVRPQMQGIEAKEAESYFYETPAPELGRRPLVRREGETRTRTVFAEQAKLGLEACRQLDEISPAEAAHALSHPATFFGPALDVASLSERVTGLGVPVRSSAPILRELASSSWWDWDMPLGLATDGEQDEDGTPELNLRDEPTRTALTTALAVADERGDQFIPAPDGRGLVPITAQLREAIQTAERLGAAAPVRIAADKVPREVLQVLENLEVLAFDRGRSPGSIPRIDPGLPPGLIGQLFGYQQEGFEWLASLYAAGTSEGPQWHGALLADDMGLGKTVQVLSFLAWLKKQGTAGPHLIVAPVALLENWQREAKKFFGVVHEPILQVIGRSIPDDPEVAAARIASQHLVLISYETLRQKERVFARVPWNVVVLDEAQKAKDPSTQVARVVRTLKARFRLGMTGTPVENSLRELWTLYDWAVPGLLGSLRAFGEKFIKPLKDGAPAQSLSEDLNQMIRPVFLRRMKQTVLHGLPKIEHSTVRVEMSAEQDELYSRILSAPASTRGTDALGRLIRLFGVLSHPRLELHDDEDLPPRSTIDFPRARRTFEILEQVAARGEKAIVFANRKKVQAWLAREIERRFGVSVDVINGDLDDSRARLRRIDDFAAQTGFAALVLAPRAAGVGLNITAANHVIHYSREWNPAIENQATDRAYRLGQERPVQVYYLVAESQHGSTVDVRLDELLTAKRRLMNDFVVPMGGFDINAEDLLGAQG